MAWLHRGSVICLILYTCIVFKMHPDAVLCYVLLASDESEYCHQILQDSTSEQLMEHIRVGPSFIDLGSFSFSKVQLLVQTSSELALSDNWWS